MDNDAIVLDGHLGWCNDLVTFELGTREIDVIGLPCQRWQAHVHLGLRIAVDSATFIVSSFKAERVEDLAFVLIAQIHPAVPAALATSKWHKGRAKLQMQRVVFEDVFGTCSNAHQVPFELTWIPFVDTRAVKQNDCPFRWLGSN